MLDAEIEVQMKADRARYSLVLIGTQTLEQMTDNLFLKIDKRYPLYPTFNQPHWLIVVGLRRGDSPPRHAEAGELPFAAGV